MTWDDGFSVVISETVVFSVAELSVSSVTGNPTLGSSKQDTVDNIIIKTMIKLRSFFMALILSLYAKDIIFRV